MSSAVACLISSSAFKPSAVILLRRAHTRGSSLRLGLIRELPGVQAGDRSRCNLFLCHPSSEVPGATAMLRPFYSQLKERRFATAVVLSKRPLLATTQYERS